MKRLLHFLLGSFLLIFLQFLLQKYWLSLSYTLDLTCFLLVLSLFVRQERDLLLGKAFFLGALSDALSLFPFGLTALTYLIVSFVLLQITDNFIIRKRRDQFLLTLLALVAKSLLDLFFLRFFEFSLSPPTLSYLILRPLFTSVTFFLVLFFLSPQGHNDAESRQP